MNADSIDSWLKRFGASDAQEEEPIDDTAGYRALLRQGSDSTPGPGRSTVPGQPRASARSSQ